MRAIAIDWSGAVRGGNIWLAVAADGQLLRVDPFPTRDAAIDRLLRHFNEDAASVAGLDFAFSFPEWFLADRGTSTAFDFWKVVARDGEDWLRACSLPFWGRPGTRRPDLLAHFRRTEAQINVAGIAPKSCFQIGGAGAVGTGSIRGIPYLSRLRAAGASIWPFEPARLPLVIEIYPRTLTGPVVKNSRDARKSYLQREFEGLDPSISETAAGSEDAFDAVVSALIMDRHFAEFSSLPDLDDIARVEGEIWSPQDRVRVPPGPEQRTRCELTRRFDQARS